MAVSKTRQAPGKVLKASKKGFKENKKILEGIRAPKHRSGRVNRILKKREPQLVEGTKRALIFKGISASQLITSALRDVAMLCKPNWRMLSRKNEILPFEDTSSLEFLSDKNDCSMFLMGSHSQKRPNNLVFVSHIYGAVCLRNITYEMHLVA